MPDFTIALYAGSLSVFVVVLALVSPDSDVPGMDAAVARRAARFHGIERTACSRREQCCHDARRSHHDAEYLAQRHAVGL